MNGSPPSMLCTSRGQPLSTCLPFRPYPISHPPFKHALPSSCRSSDASSSLPGVNHGDENAHSQGAFANMAPSQTISQVRTSIIVPVYEAKKSEQQPALEVHHPAPHITVPLPTIRSLEDSIPSPPLSNQLEDLSIESPGLAAAREYYRNIGAPSSGVPLPHIYHPMHSGPPRRHSLAIDQRLYQQVSDWSLRSAPGSRRGSGLQYTSNPERNNGDEPPPPCTVPKLGQSTISPGSMDALLADDDRRRPSAPQSILNPLDPRVLGNVPVSYTTAKLQEWGDVYLGNSVTADAFVRAVPIPSCPAPASQSPRPHSFPPAAATTTSSGGGGGGTVPGGTTPHAGSEPPARARAASRSPRRPSAHDAASANRAAPSRGLVNVRIVPRAKDRKVFFMAKRFPVRPTSSSRRVSKDYGPNPPQTGHVSRSEVLAHAMSWGEMGAPAEMAPATAMPIHVEYALYRAPLLAAILLSGHVRKGDTVEVPVPYPEAWPAVIEWVYTARSRGDGKVIENIKYLGGKIDG